MKSLHKVATSLCLLLAVFCAALANQPLQAASPCALASVHGSYEFTAPATVQVGSGSMIAIPDDLLYASPAAYASQGSLLFTGAGHIILGATATPNGPLTTPVYYTGTYTINSACTATVIFSNDTQLKLKMVGHGQAQRMVSATPGFAIVNSPR